MLDGQRFAILAMFFSDSFPYENWGGIGPSISNIRVSESVSEQSAELEMLAHLKIVWNSCVEK